MESMSIHKEKAIVISMAIYFDIAISKVSLNVLDAVEDFLLFEAFRLSTSDHNINKSFRKVKYLVGVAAKLYTHRHIFYRFQAIGHVCKLSFVAHLLSYCINKAIWHDIEQCNIFRWF